MQPLSHTPDLPCGECVRTRSAVYQTSIVVRKLCRMESVPKSMGAFRAGSSKEEFEGLTRRTIRAVVVINRHGARFPLKPFGNSAHWPSEPLFWKTYGGKLTAEVCVPKAARVPKMGEAERFRSRG